ncbi:hypothetical protein [Bosea sp. F3-2]|uniref:hypothetical protein n=1 Tax=Bosea sp. F3-2 TaxID=2599640 RepID=UPI0016556612|nr:hypothetical protein [Bosea sp. F3-2]
MIAMLKAPRFSAVPAGEKGERIAATVTAAAKRATRASFTLKTPWNQYGLDSCEVHEVGDGGEIADISLIGQMTRSSAFADF